MDAFLGKRIILGLSPRNTPHAFPGRDSRQSPLLGAANICDATVYGLAKFAAVVSSYAAHSVQYVFFLFRSRL